MLGYIGKNVVSLNVFLNQTNKPLINCAAIRVLARDEAIIFTHMAKPFQHEGYRHLHPHAFLETAALELQKGGNSPTIRDQ